MNRRQFLQSTATGSAALSMSLSTGALANSIRAPVDPFPQLDTFSFDFASVNRKGHVVDVSSSVARYFSETLGKENNLDMVAIRGARTWVGTTDHSKSVGSYERNARWVDVAPYYMARTPVTQSQWRAVAALPPISRELDPDPSCFNGDDNPVECVSWYDAQEFCERLSLKTGKRYRLPSEIEWESACRGGSSAAFHVGSTLTSELANYSALHAYDAESSGVYHRSTLPVGQFYANSYGLYDMHGNVWEWCSDPWQSTARRALRGGSWADPPARLRSASRMGYDAHSLNRIIGFRVALSLEVA